MNAAATGAARADVDHVLAYKFLDGRGRSIHTGTTWRRGGWVDAAAVDVCRAGVHACAAGDVARWLGSEMWVIELAGDVVTGQHKIAARRGRLLHRIEEYPAAVHELGALGAWATRDRAVAALRADGETGAAERFAAAASIAELRALRDPPRGELGEDAPSGALAMLAVDAAVLVGGDPAEAPFIASCAAGVAATIGERSRAAYDRAYDEERRSQSAWLTRRLRLA